jgi:transporter family-2 protein
VVRAQAGEAASEIGGRYGWVLLGLAAGAALPVQGAVNAQLRADLDAPFAVGFFSFVVATATMALLLAALLAARAAALPRVRCLETVPWWGWLGGLCGAAYVVAVFAFIPEIGVAPTVALTIAGQQLASLAVDRFGALRLPSRRISVTRAAGVALLSAGVLSIQLA